MSNAPVIVWFRRDLRLSDNGPLSAACQTGRPVIPLFIHDETVESLGAAPRWRLGAGLDLFADTLAERGSRLILRRGPALEIMSSLVEETGAEAVYWQRAYDGTSVDRDRKVKASLSDAGIEARSFPGATVFEPFDVETSEGKPYSVYTPFWRSIRGREVAECLPAASKLTAPDKWPDGDDLVEWEMGRAMRRGREIVAAHAVIGEAAAEERLRTFLDDKMAEYPEGRDHPARDVTSGLSENLAWGEISPRRIWHAAKARWDDGATGAEKFLSELGWREFAWHLLFHNPKMDRENWRDKWDDFPWRRDNNDAERWRRGMSGQPFVDAAMREMYVTGRMHNRARMVVASYLTKHLMTHWRVGLRWFEDCLIDWDPASNAMGWQWVAGSGPDAAPYFRVFNPERQTERFDDDLAYQQRWIAEGQDDPPQTALDYFRAVPESWDIGPDADYPDQLIDLGEGRKRALDAHGRFSDQTD